MRDNASLEMNGSRVALFKDKTKWAGSRLMFLSLLSLCSLSGGTLLYIVGPFFSYTLFQDYNHLKYRHYFFPMTVMFWKVVKKWLTDKDYRESFVIPLTSPPMNTPDPDRVRLSREWTGGAHDCGGCVNCCKQLGCPLLDEERGLCPSYGSYYWRYFACGRYPVTNAHARYYDCKKWVVIEDPGTRR